MRRLPVVITGLGLATPLGGCVASTWDALVAGRFITDHSRCLVPSQGEGARVSQIALHAAREAVGKSGWSSQQLEGAALVVGTSKGPVEAWMEAGGAHPTLLTGLGEIVYQVGLNLGLTSGPRLTLSTACASGLHALIRATMMVEAGEVERALVVAAESSLHPLFIGSFRRLGVIAPVEIGCRPFDKGRAGFLVSEAAAAVCLERPSRASGQVSSRVRVGRFAMGADASHLTRSDPTGQTLRRLLSSVLDGRCVDLVHAHGTGTVANDPAELEAISSVVGGESAPIVYSHKGALGHSLGAAGLVAVVLNCVCHGQGRVPGNVRTRDGLASEGLRVSAEVVERPIRRSVVMASGFGGAMGVVGLETE